MTTRKQMLGKLTGRLFVCNGAHRIAKRQRHVPRGWTERNETRANGDCVIVWYCRDCAPPVKP